MKNKNVRGIIALALVTALSFGVILGSKALTRDNGANTAAGDKVLEELDTKGVENIEKAVKTENGYMVTVKTKGYGGEIVMNVSFDKDAKKITNVEVTEQSETENLGAKIAEEDFLSQFNGVEAPVFLPGMSLEEDDSLEGAKFNDGIYEVQTPEPDDKGFTDVMTMTVKDGKITEIIWDCVTEDGKKKSVMSENGEYMMTEDGLTWREQAEALGAAIVDSQSLDGVGMNDEGKTDAVSGVSIYIGGFVNLAEQCMKQAAGIEKEAPQNGTEADAVSGATISSTAAVTAINNAFKFLQSVK